jgi:hypothetical protein
MAIYQLPMGFTRPFSDLTSAEKDFFDYFSKIDTSCIEKSFDQSSCFGPKGFGTSLILARILKIKERISSDRELALKLSKNDAYRFVTRFPRNSSPSHNTFNTLRERLEVKGFVAIHVNFVLKAHELGILDPEITELPRHRRKGIILIADSTFLLTSGSTKGVKTDDGKWLFKDNSAAFGRPHHKHKYPVGHKVHSLMTINGIPLVSVIDSANGYDQDYIITLLELLYERFPRLTFAYIILDKGYDAEEIHEDIYEYFEIIPIIIRKKTSYPKGFDANGFPLCHYGFSMRRKGIEYEHRRTKYACFKSCADAKEPLLFQCRYRETLHHYGYMTYTYFKDSYRKFGPATPRSFIYQKLKKYRTGIERYYGLVKENRYRMESSNSYKGIDNITIHVIEHDIVLTQDVIYDFLTTGNKSPIVKL